MIEGFSKIVKEKYSIFYIDFFSDDFKNLIRDELQGIFHGFAEADTLPEFYSYQNTLKSFLDRYNSKSDEIKKGMIGELLAHILIGCEFGDIKCLSILKNKEERSIKKGFDIIYCTNDNKKIWYSEVKSGHKNETETCSNFNNELLGRAKRGIQSMLTEKRGSLWESALLDVNLMINENDGQIDIKKLLSNDSPQISPDSKKNVILISSLFNSLSERIEEDSVSNFLNTTIGENLFEDVIVLSIQKNMFETIANFLEEEVNT